MHQANYGRWFLLCLHASIFSAPASQIARNIVNSTYILITKFMKCNFRYLYLDQQNFSEHEDTHLVEINNRINELHKCDKNYNYNKNVNKLAKSRQIYEMHFFFALWSSFQFCWYQPAILRLKFRRKCNRQVNSILMRFFSHFFFINFSFGLDVRTNIYAAWLGWNRNTDDFCENWEVKMFMLSTF